jgi:hypothetical protein
MKHIKIFLLTLTTLALSGCSFRYDFYIINYSDRQLKIEYQINAVDSISDNPFNSEPAVFNIDTTKSDLDVEMPKNQNVSLDIKSMTLTAILNPNQALHIGSSHTFDNKDKKLVNELFANVSRLKIISNFDTLVCTKNIIPDMFSKIKDSYRYSITKY